MQSLFRIAARRAPLLSRCASLHPVVNGSVRALSATTPASGKVIPFNLADVGEGIAKAKVIEWHVEVGDTVKEFDPICDVASDKANVDISSRYDGVIRKLHYDEGEEALVGKPLVDIEISEDHHYFSDGGQEVEESVSDDSSSSTSTQQEEAVPSSTKKVLMTPAVRRIVSENNIPIEQVIGTGKGGRVMKEDVLKFLEGPTQATTQAPVPSTPIPSTSSTPAKTQPVVIQRGLTQDETHAVTGIKEAMVKSMTAALNVPHFSYADEFEVDSLIAMKNTLANDATAQGIKLTYMPFLIKAASVALEQHPILNCHVNENCTSYTIKAEHNIGVAMDTPAGLIVPNVKNVNSKSVFEIARDLNEIQALGKEGKLSVSHLTGGTFTLSNIGILGGTYLGPVVVVPEVAIGALGRIRRVPTFDDNDNVVPKNIMEVSFSADHRIIDGVTIAKFSNMFKEFVENPVSLLAYMK
eukprot:m.52332 g.52332  ORF g.52332 m.52332 type:complete len:468 (+) comp10992_c0_seq1:434-1837(+)